MRKILLLFLLFSPLFLAAQGKFGFYSHHEVLLSMPEYLQAVEEFELLKQRCETEIECNEQELTRKQERMGRSAAVFVCYPVPFGYDGCRKRERQKGPCRYCGQLDPAAGI